MLTRLALAALLALGASVNAQVGQMPGPPPMNIATRSSYIGPCDVGGASCALFYGMRAATAAIAAAATQPLINIRNTATSETCDVIVTTNGGFGLTANCSGSSGGDTVAVFCAESAGSCAIVTVYNQITTTTCQSSNCDVKQATTTAQPTLTLSCVNSLPCAVSSTASQAWSSTNQFTITTNTTLAGVWNFSGVSTSTSFLNPSFGTSSALVGTNTTNTLQMVGYFTTLNFTALHGVWHGITNSILNSASSFAMVDGVVTIGTVNGNGGTNLVSGVLKGTNGQTLSSTEFLVSNTGWSQATATSACRNQQAYYGAVNFGAPC